MLEITIGSRRVAPSIVLPMDQVEIALRSSVRLPEGYLEEVAVIGSIRILMWRFTDYESCSNAEAKHFVGVDRVNTGRLFKLEPLNNSAIHNNISLSYFILEVGELEKYDIFDNSYKRTKVTYNFPDPKNEAERLAILSHVLSVHLGAKFKVGAWGKSSCHYCQFSGGGDLCVAKSDTGLPLVYLGSTEIDDLEAAETDNLDATETDNLEATETVPASTSSPPTSPTVSTKFSPLSYGTPKFASLVIEGKKGDFSSDTLKHQLWANMIVATVGNFTDAIVSERFTKQDLLKVKNLAGYGIACTGIGRVGMYKLEMNLIKGCTKFITKVPIRNHGQLNASLIMDYGLEQFISSVDVNI